MSTHSTHSGQAPKLFDVHTHTQFAAYADDADVVIRRSLQGEVWMVNVGTQKDTSRAAIETAHQYAEGVYATVGLHPIHTEASYHDEKELGAPPLSSADSRELANESLKGFKSREEIFDYTYYKKLAQDPKVVAIGECGLDYAVFIREQGERLQKRASAEAFGEGGLPIEKRKKKQAEVFLKHVDLAREIKKPLMIHCRNAFNDLIQILNAEYRIHNIPPGIIHFFSGTKEDAKKLLELGFSFSFGGVITFARDYDESIRFIPLDRILLETDAPYVAPVPYRGKRNEPAYVWEVAKKMAELKGFPVEKTAETMVQNARILFRI
ncbi:MAG: hypothetical protein A2934_02860 [Candidatus Sungbacteria bacterium RIFCSPLOWO2_01_FULL_47_10]|uniref:Hydrolase TatD n=1 Tax=Candidatus Sungbacteria bacterium RIFCSPLOWO2_01_FULL_47_10 TaxID=1802276 RepID=A0A1G2L8A4_9BACT|nr:MAG: hypothetical protein A2934_02860 [Candidatus Sungbacteria bacterium RIFCSPLOWO2_01_FULL_47_10]